MIASKIKPGQVWVARGNGQAITIGPIDEPLHRLELLGLGNGRIWMDAFALWHRFSYFAPTNVAAIWRRCWETRRWKCRGQRGRFVSDPNA